MKAVTVEEALAKGREVLEQLQKVRLCMDRLPKNDVEAILCRWVDRGIDGHERLEKKLKALQ